MAHVVPLALPQPYDLGWMSWYLKAHTVPGVERWDAGTYTRTLGLRHGAGLMTVGLDPSSPGRVEVGLRLPSVEDRDEVLRTVGDILALKGDGSDVARVLGADPALATVVRDAPGVRVPGAVDGWELLLRTMVGQQISLAAACTHLGRLAAHLGEPVLDGWRLMPEAAAVSEGGGAVLTGPRRRVAAVVGAAALVADGRLVLTADREPAQLRAELLDVPGIGPWTADYVVMRLCRDSDILLTTDLVARQGARLLGIDLGDTARTRRWSPYRSVATMHLWRVALAAR